MRTIRLYFLRTLSALLGSFTTAFSAALFLSGVSFLFVRALVQAEGSVASVPVLWATMAEWALPCLAALVTMRLIADDRLTGRLDLILTAPIFERDYVIGRFLGAIAYLAAVLTAYFLVPTAILPHFAPAATAGLSATAFLPALCGLLSEAFLCSALGLFMSAVFRQAAVAAVATVFVFVALPRTLYAVAYASFPWVRANMPVYPGMDFLADVAGGVFYFSALVFSLVFTSSAIFLATKAVAVSRFLGRGSRTVRLSTYLVCLLCLVFASLSFFCAWRLNFTFAWSPGAKVARFSPRTYGVLADVGGEMTRVTCFLSKRDPLWGGLSRLLDSLKDTGRIVGARLSVDYADPRWDVATALRLVRSGVNEGSVVFERAGRRIVVPVGEVDEAACASALQRLILPVGREKVYWTTGHGEASFEDYESVTGMSALARTLRGEGHELQTFDSTAAAALPDDCGVLVVAGARTAFSAQELAFFDAYLRREGRLLVLLSPEGRLAGLGPLLAEWGVKALPYTVVSPHTVNGADLVASDYGAHAITRPLAGTSLIFHGAAPLASTLTATGGVERLAFTPLVKSDADAWGESDIVHLPWTRDVALEPQGPFVLAAAVERGGLHSRDLALKPSRLVVVGDAAFASNGALATRANANRDFFRNALAWLLGLDAATASGTPPNVLVMGMDRALRHRFAATACLLGPLSVLVLCGLVSLRRRFGK